MWSEITDKSIPDIVSFKDVETLMLGGTKLTGEGVQQLATMKKLKSVLLSNSIPKDSSFA
jgi:hypothetical protein